jgi:hypothetical protein
VPVTGPQYRPSFVIMGKWPLEGGVINPKQPCVP